MTGEKGIITLSIAEAVISDEIYYLITSDTEWLEENEGWSKTPSIDEYQNGMHIYSRHRIEYSDGGVIFTEPIEDISSSVAIELSDVDGKCDVYFGSYDDFNAKSVEDIDINDIFYVLNYKEEDEDNVHDYLLDEMYRLIEDTNGTKHWELYNNENVKKVLNSAEENRGDNNKITVFSQSSEPEIKNLGDLWIINNKQISNLIIYYWDGSAWKTLSPLTTEEIISANESIQFVNKNRDDLSKQLSAINIDENNGRIVIKTISTADSNRKSQMTLTASELRFDFTTGTTNEGDGYASFGEKHAKFGNFIQTSTTDGGLAFVYVGAKYGGDY